MNVSPNCHDFTSAIPTYNLDRFKLITSCLRGAVVTELRDVLRYPQR